MMNSKWFSTFNQKSRPETKLFCFPYAGGNASTFASWHEGLPEHVSVLGLQTPGRASRLLEAPIDNMEEMAATVAQQMAGLLDVDYVMFGHSLGARIAFEVALKLMAMGLPAPRCFIASGSPAPSIARTELPIYNLPESDFIEELRKMGGTPDAVLQSEELRDIILPAIRADFKIVDNYWHSRKKLQTRAHVLNGMSDDTVSMNDARSWAQHFHGSCTLHPIEGDHFFVDANKKQVLSVLYQILAG